MDKFQGRFEKLREGFRYSYQKVKGSSHTWVSQVKDRWLVFWRIFSHLELRNIIVYVSGLMLFRFGLDVFNWSIITLALDRFGSAQFEKLGALTALNLVMQCVGAVLIVFSYFYIWHRADGKGPMAHSNCTHVVLAIVVFSFAFMTTPLLVIDRASGGSIQSASASFPHYGDYSPNILFPIFMTTGIYSSK